MNPKWGDQISSRNIGAVLHFQWHGHGLRPRRLRPWSNGWPAPYHSNQGRLLPLHWNLVWEMERDPATKGPTENQTFLVAVGLCFEETASWPMPLQLRCGAWLSAQSWLLQRQDSAYDFSFPHVIMSLHLGFMQLWRKCFGQDWSHEPSDRRLNPPILDQLLHLHFVCLWMLPPHASWREVLEG